MRTLPQMKNLMQLTLIGPEMKDDILPHLARLPLLTLAFSGGAHITDASVPDLKKMTRLTSLNVGPKMSDAGIEELRKALPGCQVER